MKLPIIVTHDIEKWYSKDDYDDNDGSYDAYGFMMTNCDDCNIVMSNDNDCDSEFTNGDE